MEGSICLVIIMGYISWFSEGAVDIEQTDGSFCYFVHYSNVNANKLTNHLNMINYELTHEMKYKINLINWTIQIYYRFIDSKVNFFNYFSFFKNEYVLILIK